jgi:conjugal transfer pilus assembly protein TraF
MEALHQQVKQSLYQAILNPTLDNMHAYIALQNQVNEQAHRFSAAWQVALLNHPELDYSLSHPTNAIGSQVYLSRQKSDEDKAISLLAKHSGLFFFYQSTCPYCQRFAPIVKSFSERYGISVVPITTDGISLPSFPHSHPDQGQAARFKVTMEPALFTVDPYSQKIIPVGYGLMTEDELRARILMIAQQSKDTAPSG